MQKCEKFLCKFGSSETAFDSTDTVLQSLHNSALTLFKRYATTVYKALALYKMATVTMPRKFE